MALQFKPNGANGEETIPVQVKEEAVQTVTTEVPQTFSIVEAKTELENEIKNSPEIDRLTSTIDVQDPNTIVRFGAEVAEEISKASDQVLNSMNMSQINDSGQLLANLAAVMDKFDSKELANDDNGFFAKLFGNIKKELDKLLAKYHTMGEDVDKIYLQLKGYEKEIGESNVKLEKMFAANMNYYNELLKYILAGEQGVKEFDTYIADFQKQVEANPADGNIRMDLTTLEQCRAMLEQRVMDLRIAENVAMQSIPMLKTMQFSNLNLIRKINSAFIITMPIFKQALAQAVMLKRQRVQAEALQALDDKTNEMLIKNADNTVAQAKLTAQLASGSSIKVETLEKTWQTIVTGIEETKRIEEEARTKRQADSVKLEQMKKDYKEKFRG